MAAAGFKRKLLLSKNDQIRVAEIMNEKDELQQINEKMLDMLTEKELDNDELNEKLENYKLEVKIENEKNLEQKKYYRKKQRVQKIQKTMYNLKILLMNIIIKKKN